MVTFKYRTGFVFFGAFVFYSGPGSSPIVMPDVNPIGFIYTIPESF
jgi:hypothetical protein